MAEQQPKTYVLDTNVLIQSPYSIYSFDEHNVLLADVTLEEIDGLKSRPGEVGANAREVNRILESLREQGNIAEGVPLPGGGSFRIEVNHLKAPIPESWDPNKPDNRILRVCKGLKDEGANIILVSMDIAMRLKADILHIPAEDYRTERVSDPASRYMGRADVYAGSLDGFFEKKYLDAQGLLGEDGKIAELIVNEFLVIHDSRDLSRTALGRFDGEKAVPLCYADCRPYGVTPRNAGQIFAQEALLSPAETAPLVILKGAAGTAKTFYSLAAGLDRLLNVDRSPYRRILVARPNIKFDEDIGYLKGTEEDKIGPLIRPIMDNLELLARGGGKAGEENSYAQDLFDHDLIVAQALAYMRGRSIPDTWILIDEAQNMTPVQAFGIISRAGVGSKVILAGDPDQIDNPRLTARTNGLSYAAERMLGSPLCWQLTFDNSECTRSPLALEAIGRMTPKGYC